MENLLPAFKGASDSPSAVKVESVAKRGAIRKRPGFHHKIRLRDQSLDFSWRKQPQQPRQKQQNGVLSSFETFDETKQTFFTDCFMSDLEIGTEHTLRTCESQSGVCASTFQAGVRMDGVAGVKELKKDTEGESENGFSSPSRIIALKSDKIELTGNLLSDKQDKASSRLLIESFQTRKEEKSEEKHCLALTCYEEKDDAPVSANNPFEGKHEEKEHLIQVLNAAQFQAENTEPDEKRIFSVFQAAEKKGDRQKRIQYLDLYPGTAMHATPPGKDPLDVGSSLTLIANPRVYCSILCTKIWTDLVGPYVRSTDDKRQRVIQFRNCSLTKSVSVYWVSYEGELMLRRELKPSSSFIEKAYASHPYLIVTGKTRRRCSSQELLVVLNARIPRPGVVCSILWNAKSRSLSLAQTTLTSTTSVEAQNKVDTTLCIT